MKLKFFPAVLAMASASLFAQPDTSSLDAYLDALGNNNKFMGTVMLSKNGKPVYSRSVGFADVEAQTKITESTKFRIGSISKTFTAALVFKSIEDKKLSLEDKLSKFFPTIPNAEKITIAHLLSHRSGIHNFTDDDDYLSWHSSSKTPQQMVELISRTKSGFEPGTQANYSNSNYVLLTMILEKATKKSYKTLLEEKITRPLALKNTYYGSTINTTNNEARSYRWSGKWDVSAETDMSIPMGAGAIVSTTSDLSRFIKALFDRKIVSPQSLAKMQDVKDKYGMGLVRFPFNEKTAYGHTGGIDGFASMLAHFPDDDVTIAFTSNGSNFNNNQITIAALSWYFGMPVTVPNFTTFDHSESELELLTGSYASPGFPLKINITRNGNVLMAQATGQNAFPLDATAKNAFEFARAGVVLEFRPESSEMTLKQGGGAYVLTKEQ